MALLVVLFIVLPIAELYVIVQVAQGIGILPTLALLLLDGFVGAALARSQGRAAWERFNRALAEGRVPARETFDGAMIIFGGALLLTPGFLTDILGLALLIPPSRALLRGAIARLAKRRATIGWTVVSGPAGRGPGPGTGQRPGGFGRRPDYDYEGSAREVSDPAGELPPRREDD
jgi:UPF0716 protein FxsA